jgi:cellulose biosynthesis protein BcsQ
MWKLTGKRILLVDVDSTQNLPNLVLMKVSAYHKSKGDAVTLICGSKVKLPDKPDKIYISVISVEYPAAC